MSESSIAAAVPWVARAKPAEVNRVVRAIEKEADFALVLTTFYKDCLFAHRRFGNSIQRFQQVSIKQAGVDCADVSNVPVK